jgi:hypothetical protein
MPKAPRKDLKWRPAWNNEKEVAKLARMRPIRLYPVFDFTAGEGDAIKQANRAMKQAEEQMAAGTITEEDAIKQIEYAFKQLKPSDFDASDRQALEQAKAGEHHAIAPLLRELANAIERQSMEDLSRQIKFAITQENTADLLEKIKLGFKPAPDDFDSPFDSPPVLLRDFARGLFANHGKACELAAAILEGEFKPPKKRKTKPKQERAALSVLPDAERAYAEIVGFFKWIYPDQSKPDISDRAFRLAARQFGIKTNTLVTYWRRSENNRRRLSPRPEIPQYPKPPEK